MDKNLAPRGSGRFLDTPEAVANAIRESRKTKRWSQAKLAKEAKVGRRLIVDLESGHERAELGKVLAVLSALDIFAVALPEPPHAGPSHEVDFDEYINRFR